MAITILHAATAVALAAAGSLVSGSQQAQCEALVSPWAGSNVRVRIYSGTTLRRTLTIGPWTINTTASPRRVVSGAGLADAAVSAGVQTRVVFELLDGTPIFECGGSAASSGAEINWQYGQIRTLCTPTLALEFLANAALPAADFPSWIPAAGQNTTLTNSNGRLGNNLRSVISPLYNPVFANKLITDYAGGILNRHFGPYGARQFFGPGHSASNYNGVVSLTLGNVCTWSQIQPPTDYGGGPGGNDLLNITSLVDATWGDIGQVPAAPHSWQTQFILPPANGGAACGSLIQVLNPAAGAIGLNFQTSHKLDIPSTAPGSGTWSRFSAGGGFASPSVWPAPPLVQFVPNQMRAYITTNGPGAPRPNRWFDLATGQFVTGSGVGFNYDDADSAGGGADASGRMLYSSSRQRMFLAMRFGGNLRIEWMDVSVAQPTLGGVVTLSQAVPIAGAAWSACCICEETNRIIVLGAQSTKVFEIDIPASSGAVYTVTEVNLPTALLTGEEGSAFTRVFGKADWNPLTKCVEIVVNTPHTSGDDLVSVYRPLGT